MYADSESAEGALRDISDTEIDGRKLFLRKVGGGQASFPNWNGVWE